MRHAQTQGPRTLFAILALLVPELVVERANATPVLAAFPFEEPTSSAPGEASVALSVGARLGPPSHDWRAGVLVAIPVEQLATRPRRTASLASATPRVAASAPPSLPSAPVAPSSASSKRPVAKGSTAEQAAPIAKGPPDGAPRAAAPTRVWPNERELRELVDLTGRDLRDATEAALRAGGRLEDVARLGDLSRRARWSSALPDLRLRVARASSENAALAPTSYDPLRQTSSGGTSTWLEVRATWSLGRALFASEELRLARFVDDHRRADDELARRLATLLFEWQDAVAERLDPSTSFRECRRAHLHELQRAAELDHLTGGWFERFRAQRPALPESDCFAVAERLEP